MSSLSTNYWIIRSGTVRHCSFRMWLLPRSFSDIPDRSTRCRSTSGSWWWRCLTGRRSVRSRWTGCRRAWACWRQPRRGRSDTRSRTCSCRPRASGTSLGCRRRRGRSRRRRCWNSPWARLLHRGWFLNDNNQLMLINLNGWCIIYIDTHGLKIQGRG